MTTVSTPHSVNQSTSRCRSAVKVPKLRTGSGARSALTAAMCRVAPMSMAAAFGCTMGIVRSTLDFDLLRFISNPPADMRKGWAAQFIQIPKRDRRDGVTTLKYATAHGPGFLTGSHATKIISAAPFRPQCSDKCVSIPQGASSAQISFLEGAHQGGIAERKAMIDREHDLSITKQAEILKVSRGSVYYLPRPVSSADLEIMRQLDRLHLEYPFAGSRMLRGLLALQGCKVGRRHVKTLMRRMGIEALYRRPRTTRPEPGHKIHPYLLRGMEITRPNQVWAMDITYIPMASGFVYLAVVLDWATRRVLSWRLSITMEAAFCVETLEDALARHGKPEIFNTDQGSQFTGQAFTGVLADNGIAISMDGKGAWRDNVFVERLWRSIKYEEVYLRAYDSVSEARSSIGRYLDFYNGRRPHSSLDGTTPDQAYFSPLPLRMAA